MYFFFICVIEKFCITKHLKFVFYYQSEKNGQIYPYVSVDFITFEKVTMKVKVKTTICKYEIQLWLKFAHITEHHLQSAIFFQMLRNDYHLLFFYLALIKCPDKISHLNRQWNFISQRPHPVTFSRGQKNSTCTTTSLH